MTITIPLPLPLRVHLIRHGETEWALSGQHTGRTDIPLNLRGEDDAGELGSRLRGVSFSLVLTSPLQRARRTCELVGLKAITKIEPDLAEWDYGEYEGLRSARIIETRPGWNLFRHGCPNGESPAQVAERADRLIARVRVLAGNVALFSHGQFGAVLAARWIGLPLLEAEHFPFGTASLSILSYAAQHPTVSVIEKWNVTAQEITSSATSLDVDSATAIQR